MFSVLERLLRRVLDPGSSWSVEAQDRETALRVTPTDCRAGRDGPVGMSTTSWGLRGDALQPLAPDATIVRYTEREAV